MSEGVKGECVKGEESGVRGETSILNPQSSIPLLDPRSSSLAPRPYWLRRLRESKERRQVGRRVAPYRFGRLRDETFNVASHDAHGGAKLER